MCLHNPPATPDYLPFEPGFIPVLCSVPWSFFLWHFSLHLQTYDIQGNLQNDSQVTVSVIFENKSTSFLKSMELNVLDSLNTKMLRPEGSSVHDGIPVPFQLPPGMHSFAQGSWSVAGPALPSCGKSCFNFLLLSRKASLPWVFLGFPTVPWRG